jgi:hypothetical protein
MKNTELVKEDVAYHAKRIVSLNLRIILGNKLCLEDGGCHTTGQILLLAGDAWPLMDCC